MTSGSIDGVVFLDKDKEVIFSIRGDYLSNGVCEGLLRSRPMQWTSREVNEFKEDVVRIGNMYKKTPKEDGTLRIIRRHPQKSDTYSRTYDIVDINPKTKARQEIASGLSF